MHEHKVCEHELKYCSICDVAYCDKCKKEWRNYTITYTSPFAYYNGHEEINPDKPINVTPVITNHQHS